MNHPTEALEQASIRQYCRAVRTPAIAANFIPLAEQAIKEHHSHIRYLEALLAMECEERDRHAIANRIRDAQLPRMKTLEEFDFTKAPQIPAAKMRDLAQGGYIPLADIGAEFLFQVISDRAERAALIVTTNLPFSEWTTVFPNPRLCKALLDRVTDRAHIIETGTESFRFKRTMEGRKKK
jgi:DNA replication protein DnaC